MELYEAGRCEAAIRGLNTQHLTVAAFTEALDQWLKSRDPAGGRTRLGAAAFALDAVWNTTRTVFNARSDITDPSEARGALGSGRVSLTFFTAQPLVARWAVEQLPVAGPVSSLERTLWLTAVGVAADGHAWYQLGHDLLPLARERLPDEPRLRLAEVIARTSRELGPLRNADSRRSDILRDERLSASVTRRIEQAVEAFEPLVSDPRIKGEVELRIGYLELRRRRWPIALARFESAAAATEDPTIGAAAHYFAGWVHEQLGRPDQAIASYRRANQLAPKVRNLSTRLAALLFLHNERDEAYAVLDAALNARPQPLDLLVAVERADGRFVPGLLSTLRGALQ